MEAALLCHGVPTEVLHTAEQYVVREVNIRCERRVSERFVDALALVRAIEHQPVLLLVLREVRCVHEQLHRLRRIEAHGGEEVHARGSQQNGAHARGQRAGLKSAGEAVVDSNNWA